MPWNWPALSYLFGGQAAAVQDWMTKWGWVFWVILALIITVVIVWIYIKIRGH